MHAADLKRLVQNKTEPHSIVTFVVLSIFLLELILRQIVQQMKFWGKFWNIFDVIVIYASWVMAIIQHHLANNSAKEGQSAATPLRLISRLVMIVRVIRLLAYASKRAKSLSVGGQLGAYSNMKRQLNDPHIRPKKIEKTPVPEHQNNSIAFGKSLLNEHKGTNNFHVQADMVAVNWGESNTSFCAVVSEESGVSNQDMSMHGSLFRSDTDVDGGKGRKFDESTHGSHGIDVSIHSIREAFDESAIKKYHMSRNNQSKRHLINSKQKSNQDGKLHVSWGGEESYYGEHLEDYMHDVALARLCQEQTLAMRLYETRIASLQRCVAFFVLFHQMGKRVADFWPAVSFG